MEIVCKLSKLTISLFFHLYIPITKFFKSLTEICSKSKNKTSEKIRKEVRMNFDQLERLERAAMNHGMKPTVFLCKAAFAYIDSVFILPDKQQIQSFELRFREIANAINILTQRNQKFDHKDFQMLHDLLDTLERSIVEIFRHPLNLEYVIREAITNHPYLHKWMREKLLDLDPKE